MVLGGLCAIFGILIPFFNSFRSKDIHDKLDEERGSTWGTLPKGFGYFIVQCLLKQQNTEGIK